MTVMHLESLGRRRWADARAVLDGFTCAWAGIDGFRIGDAPEEPPAFSHLWGWRGKECVRVRIDEDHVYGAVLHEAASSDDAERFDEVAVVVRSGRIWDRGDGQAGPLPEAAYGLTLELVEVPGQAVVGGGGPMTFIRDAP